MVHDAVGRRLHLCSAANWGKSNIGLFFLCLKARLSEQKNSLMKRILKEVKEKEKIGFIMREERRKKWIV